MARDRGDRSVDKSTDARIESMKQRLQQKADGRMIAWESEEIADDERERFWQRVVAFEEGPFTTDFERLVAAGIELPEPDALDGERLTAKLWEVIHALARMNVVLESTDHLSDRELYVRLWSDALREEIPVHDDVGTWHVDLVSGGGEEDTDAYLKFYADEEERRRWREHFPDHVVPEHADPPYDRDRHMPVPGT
jgi:hypothetical protein